jgi:hypothetical protein
MRTSTGALMVCATLLLAGIAAPRALRGEPAPSTRDSQNDLMVLFQSANSSYEQGDYEEAIKTYRSLLDAGVNNTDLYYNIANAYFKNGDLGRAVLSYERALERSPRDEDAKKNLELVRSMLKDNQFVEKKMWLMQIVTWAQRSLSLNESLMLSSLLYVLLCLVAIGFMFMDSRVVRAAHGRLFKLSPGRLLGLTERQDFATVVLLLGVLCIASSGISIHKVVKDRSRAEAVVVAPEVPVYSAPSDDSVLQFRIHAGTKVRLKEKRSGWVRISLPGGLTGWISGASAETI